MTKISIDWKQAATPDHHSHGGSLTSQMEDTRQHEIAGLWEHFLALEISFWIQALLRPDLENVPFETDQETPVMETLAHFPPQYFPESIIFSFDKNLRENVDPS